MEKTTLGTKIMLLREWAELDQKELAAKMDDPNDGKISNWENDKHMPGFDSILKIAEICKMNVGYFGAEYLPGVYHQIGTLLPYAFYLSTLPHQAKKYLCHAISEAYKLYILEQAEAKIPLHMRKSEIPLPERVDYEPTEVLYKLLDKKQIALVDPKAPTLTK